MSEYLLSISATISAIGTLFAGIAAFLAAFPEFRNKIGEIIFRTTTKPKTKVRTNNMVKQRNYLLIITIISLSYSILIFSYQNIFSQNGKDKVPLNQFLTTAAWNYYNNKDYSKSIESANKCIKLFKGQAEILQEQLTENSVKKPNVNPDKKEKSEIFSRGLLNDVATCYYIVGLCYYELRDKDKAKIFFSKAEYFTYAMCWEPQGWFWNISEAAFGRLSE
ncbi:MAG: hypothetical protein V1773_18300 [bacterium]